MTTYTEEKGVQRIKELKQGTMFMKEGGYKRMKKNSSISRKQGSFNKKVKKVIT